MARKKVRRREKLLAVQADLVILQFVLAKLVTRLMPQERETLLRELSAVAQRVDDLNAQLPIPGVAEKLTHEVNMAARKFLDMAARVASG